MAAVVESSSDAQGDAGAVEAGGYRQELKRTLGSFQAFAISFAFISVAGVHAARRHRTG
ncbi:hypothetical protein [Streptomyces sp. NBC_01565]|uniref:hypothetical protein n=1 Tax=unclassified Streptomyces TaxID=2593676 RepID=UPI002251C678|nr:hypothetical protein [Streptomyces sp. NBC_01565]MCX4547027.1 hypothetical protein [Streptomyces sp. NBC_01565]